MKSNNNLRKLLFVALLVVIVPAAWWLYGNYQFSVSSSHIGGGTLWTCSMHPQVVREEPGTCPICHMQLVPIRGPVQDVGSAASSNEAGGGKRKIKYWWDPMLNPPYISDKPGKSPMGMDLIPVYEDEAPSGGAGVSIDPVIVQNIGLRTARVERKTLTRKIDLFGTLEEAQENVREINLRASGWITKMFIQAEGQHVQAGEKLFELYSPELKVAAQELIASAGSIPALREAAMEKLRLLGLQKVDIESIRSSKTAPETFVIRSPIAGHVTQKPIVEGSAIKAGQTALRIVDHSMLWFDAHAFENQLPLLSVGLEAQALIDSLSGQEFKGKITFIHPHVDMAQRTGLVRAEFANPELVLKPGMYGRLLVNVTTPQAVTIVPSEAVIDSGRKKLIFVSQGRGHFEPREVETGAEDGEGSVEIKHGVLVGEIVVTSGQFLLDSESRLREVVQKYLSEKRAAAVENGEGAP